MQGVEWWQIAVIAVGALGLVFPSLRPVLDRFKGLLSNRDTEPSVDPSAEADALQESFGYFSRLRASLVSRGCSQAIAALDREVLPHMTHTGEDCPVEVLPGE